MKKYLSCALMVLFLGIVAQAQSSREQKVERVTQALNTWQDSGEVWRGRTEYGGWQRQLGTITIKYPGKVKWDLERNSSFSLVCDGTKVKYGNGNERELDDWSLWVLVGGKIGKDVEILSVDDNTGLWGGESSILVADLQMSFPSANDLNLRIYVSADGEPRLLGWGSNDPVLLKDLHKVKAKPNQFSFPVL